jgi:hypothetical protein
MGILVSFPTNAWFEVTVRFRCNRTIVVSGVAGATAVPYLAEEHSFFRVDSMHNRLPGFHLLFCVNAWQARVSVAVLRDLHGLCDEKLAPMSALCKTLASSWPKVLEVSNAKGKRDFCFDHM